MLLVLVVAGLGGGGAAAESDFDSNNSFVVSTGLRFRFYDKCSINNNLV